MLTREDLQLWSKTVGDTISKVTDVVRLDQIKKKMDNVKNKWSKESYWDITKQSPMQMQGKIMGDVLDLSTADMGPLSILGAKDLNPMTSGLAKTFATQGEQGIKEGMSNAGYQASLAATKAIYPNLDLTGFQEEIKPFLNWIPDKAKFMNDYAKSKISTQTKDHWTFKVVPNQQAGMDTYWNQNMYTNMYRVVNKNAGYTYDPESQTIFDPQGNPTSYDDPNAVIETKQMLPFWVNSYDATKRSVTSGNYYNTSKTDQLGGYDDYTEFDGNGNILSQGTMRKEEASRRTRENEKLGNKKKIVPTGTLNINDKKKSNDWNPY